MSDDDDLSLSNSDDELKFYYPNKLDELGEFNELSEIDNNSTPNMLDKSMDNILDKDIDKILNDLDNLSEISNIDEVEVSNVKSKIIFFEKITKDTKVVKKKVKILKQDFKCPICGILYNNEIDVNEHYLLRHCIRKLEGRVSCGICGGDFDNEEDYTDHDCSGDGEIGDSIPTDIRGRYSCPICNNRYLTQNMLGEHFLVSHNSYESYSALDENRVDGGFPGFDILEHIGMIERLSDGDVDRIVASGDKCEICFSMYKFKEKPFNAQFNMLKLSDKKDKNDKYDKNGYCSDSEIHLIDRYEIEDKKLQGFCNRFRQIERIPIKILCCDAHLCFDCLENNIKITGKIVCPFCKRDHTKTDVNYITIIEESDITDRKKWISWWIKHHEIFY